MEAKVDLEAGGRLEGKRIFKKIDPVLLEPVTGYLFTPYQEGYWSLEGTWKTVSPFSLYLLKKLKIMDTLAKAQAVSPGSTSNLLRSLSSEKKYELLSATSRLSSIFALFSNILRKKKGEDLQEFQSFYSWINSFDIDDVAKKFSKALEIFEKKIWFDDFSFNVPRNNFFRLKGGLVSVLKPPAPDHLLHIAAFQYEQLIALRDFYEALGIIHDTVIRRVFSPDEELFRPYFAVVSAGLANIIADQSISTTFSRALEYYESSDFQHCVSTLGLIGEDYLHRIFVSLIREQLPGNLTLGQTLDRLHKRVDEHYVVAKQTQTGFDAVFNSIKSLQTGTDVTELKPILRTFVELVQSDRAYYTKRFDELTKPAVRKSPFPAHVFDCLNELLKWRNAASHNSRIPLGAHEADRTLFCLVTLISWWQQQLNGLDWRKGKWELIEELVENAKMSQSK
ncbi:hypothetical protein C798_19855 [Herbaspirillum rubrisubalbicans Os34]|uniref:Uncharacterized protein n=1 Tax=Herbaspirillum rubrisubalbicans Os34 TaxID=1235827 RepID=A0A6M3ZVL6_9BURK|nr:hypothetical protein C798_19855 [Herbaspirillum rubrisubalbicans Os34]